MSDDEGWAPEQPQTDDAAWIDDPVWIDESMLFDPQVDAANWRRSDPMADLECLDFEMRVRVARQYRMIDDILSDAERDPETMCGPDPTLDPAYQDPRARTTSAIRRERASFAVRAAVLDISMRLRMSEIAVQARRFTAMTLRERCPRLWDAFRSGLISESNARSAADAAGTLPGDAPDAWAAFDEAVESVAARLTPAKFRVRVRAIRERVHAESLEIRHTRAAAQRAVWMTPEYDGMAVLSAKIPIAGATAAMRRIDTTARHLRHQEGESRTLDQLRADVFTDLLTSTAEATLAGNGPVTVTAPGTVTAAASGTATGAGIATATPGGASDATATAHDTSVRTGAAAGVTATVAITIPVMTLLGHDTAPATLDGYGPIDLDTAKRLAGGATSWVRILTHPVTGTVLDVDRKTYRVPADLRRWLGVMHPTCISPGCNRSSRECAIDHQIEWQYGGTTCDINLGPLCERHHVVKTETSWRIDRDPGDEPRWTSPTGATSNLDPPPF